MIKKELLITGCPKCGTGYMTAYANAVGYNIGHEYINDDGICSWMFAVDDIKYPYGEGVKSKYEFEKVFCVVRHPLDGIQTLYNIEYQKGAKRGLDFRSRHIGEDLSEQTWDNAARQYFGWYDLIKKNWQDAIWVRVEHPEDLLKHLPNKTGRCAPIHKINSKGYTRIDRNTIYAKLNEENKKKVDEWMKRFGYE